tara:strand:- start:737 stop:901 length:165 start_codon:yes stop_codon:yes gene_type:complete
MELNLCKSLNGKNTLPENKDFKLCKGSFRTDLKDNWLCLEKERAWSSPIYLSKP